MKKLLVIVILGLLLNFNAIAEEKVFYCVDDAATGYDIEKSGTISKTFKGARFKAKIDFEKGIFDPKELSLDGPWKKLERNTFTDEIISFIRFYDVPNFKYIRSSHFGPYDSVYVAIGSCSKF